MFQNITAFLQGVREEIQRVAWPDREELIGSALVVVVGVALLASYVSVLDFFMSKFVRLFLR